MPHRIVGGIELLVADEDAARRSARSTPVITLISVDLPAPLSPIRPTISFRPMASEMSRSACTAPKYFLHVLQPHDVL